MFALKNFSFTMQSGQKQMDGTEPDITEVEDEVYRKVEESQE
jgi:hypothetical protein